MANNGVDFFEDTDAHTGVWCGFMPHGKGCKVAAVTLTDGEGTEVDGTPSWVGTTLDLDSYISAGLADNLSQAYITSITLTSGACTLVKDTLTKLR